MHYDILLIYTKGDSMTRDDKIMVRVTAAEKELLRVQAEKSHMTVAAMVRHLVFKAMAKENTCS